MRVRRLLQRRAQALEAGNAESRLIRPLFDTEWYLERYADVRNAGVDPLEHFLTYGGSEARDPHPLFSSSWYLAHYPDVAAGRLNPLVHYMQIGAAQGREPHPLFDTGWYRAQTGNILPKSANPLLHYLEIGASAALSPHPLLDARAYLEDNPDVARFGRDALSHFVTYGHQEGRNPHRLFLTDWYLQRNPAVRHRSENPLVHYLTKGGFEGCDPNPAFDNHWYLEQNSDVRVAQIPPLLHYVTVGAAEGRRPNPDFDPAWYAETHAQPGRPVDDALAHYLRDGQAQGFPTQAIVARHPVAVIFLARSENGSTVGMDRFPRSYRSFAAGLPHDLFVIRKGEARKPGARATLSLMFEGTDAQFIDLSDDGFDIHAYLKAAATLPHEYLCFLNTASEITADNWLQKLHAPLADPGVGLAGATASYESITDTIDLGSKVIWLAGRNELPLDRETIEIFRSQLAVHAADWIERAEVRSAKGAAETATHGLAIDRDVDYARFWCSATKPSGPLEGFSGFRRFPNPHVRTNGFIIRRKLLLECDFDVEETKLACNHFESGPGGLPERLAARGLRAILVGADGRTFEVDRWAESGTFRLGDQKNVLIRDNRVEEFALAAPGERERLALMAWGAYSGPVPAAVQRLGFGFERGPLDVTPRAMAACQADAPLVIGIAIPTHNRLSLVREALTTIVSQNYPHWTCIVFDNASTEPLREMIESFADDRISYARSDRFLPVTDSWNNAIDRARGDYVLLIGDDDGLAPDGLKTIEQIVRRYRHPDVIYSALYQFFHPGVAPWQPSGYVSRLRYGFFFGDRTEPFLLDSKAARLAVAGSLEFRRNFTYNMQAFFFRRDFVELMRRDGKVFLSPFPDYYLANLAFGLARDVVVLPEPVSIAGVSRKSFGFTLFNNLSEKGDSMLATDLDEDPLWGPFSRYRLPGPSYDTKFALTMEHVAHALGPAAPVKVNVDRYRRLQIFKSLGGVPGLTGTDKSSVIYSEQVRVHLSRAEATWAENLQRLGARAAQGDGAARSALDRVAGLVSMYAPPELAVQHDDTCIGEFDSLPRLFSGIRAGRLSWPTS
jgi:hypothetical protein